MSKEQLLYRHISYKALSLISVTATILNIIPLNRHTDRTDRSSLPLRAIPFEKLGVGMSASLKKFRGWVVWTTFRFRGWVV